MKTQSYVITVAGSGLGHAIASTISESVPNSRTYLLGRNWEKLEAVRVELPRSESHVVLVADVRDPQSLMRAIRGSDLATANLVGIIANAGVGGENKYGPDDRWDE